MDTTTNPEIFTFGKRYWYPHMKPADIAIWERFIEKYPSAYDTCQYDVPVGDDPKFPTETGPRPDDATWKLYQKKIDVVGSKNGKLAIMELKPNAGSAAVGQIKLYKKLYMRDYSPPEEPDMIIITDKIAPDVHDFALDEGVDVIVV